MTKREQIRNEKIEALRLLREEIKAEISQLNEDLDEQVNEVSYFKGDIESAAADMVDNALNLIDADDCDFQRAAEDYRDAKENAADLEAQIEFKEDELEKVEKKLSKFKKVKKSA